jgi:hypothetical protein
MRLQQASALSWQAAQQQPQHHGQQRHGEQQHAQALLAIMRVTAVCGS